MLEKYCVRRVRVNNGLKRQLGISLKGFPFVIISHLDI